MLGSLGQLAIVVRATIRLVPAPTRARTYQLFYSDLDTYLADQRRALAEGRFTSLEGQVQRTAACSRPDRASSARRADPVRPAPPGLVAAAAGVTKPGRSRVPVCSRPGNRRDLPPKQLAATFCQTPSARGGAVPFDFDSVDTGDTAWVLASAALVLLMTPGLAFFYGGMVRAKSALNMIMMNFVTHRHRQRPLGAVYGFSVAFGDRATASWAASTSPGCSTSASSIPATADNGGAGRSRRSCSRSSS